MNNKFDLINGQACLLLEKNIRLTQTSSKRLVRLPDFILTQAETFAVHLLRNAKTLFDPPPPLCHKFYMEKKFSLFELSQNLRPPPPKSVT